jgi:hypothetical protein
VKVVDSIILNLMGLVFLDESLGEFKVGRWSSFVTIWLPPYLAAAVLDLRRDSCNGLSVCLSVCLSEYLARNPCAHFSSTYSWSGAVGNWCISPKQLMTHHTFPFPPLNTI